jgi:phosphoribosyl-ATP pyrophosphohydrolase
MGERTENVFDADLGEVLAELLAIIGSRAKEQPEGSYTVRLLQGGEDMILKKIGEEATELVLACKDDDHDHIRYEAADLIYHLLVMMRRYGITAEELAGELRARM